MEKLNLISAIFVLAASSSAQDEGSSVTIRLGEVSAHPGEEVAVEFRADVPLAILDFMFHFTVPPEIADFVGVDLAGTASAHAPWRGIRCSPRYRFLDKEGYIAGVQFKTQNTYIPLAPGKDLLLLKAIFRVKADSVPGDSPMTIDDAWFTASEVSKSIPSVLPAPSVFRVLPPVGPRPAGDLACGQEGAETVLTWSVTEAGWSGIRVTGTGGVDQVLPGDATTFRDRPAVGPASYRVTALRDGASSLPASCEILVQMARPRPVDGFAGRVDPAGVILEWTVGAAYDGIWVYRNGTMIGDLEGTTTTFVDPVVPDLFTVYSAVARAGGVESLASRWELNSMSGAYVMWAEDVRAAPGDTRVPVRIFGTHPKETQSLQVGLRIDPLLATIADMSLEGTPAEPIYFIFLFQDFRLNLGETGAGIMFPKDEQLPAAGEQHLLTLLVDVPADAVNGSVIPIVLGAFGRPPIACAYTVEDRSVHAEVRPGSILVGRSPVPEVTGASAEVLDVGGAGGGSADPEHGVRLRWRNEAAYQSIRIERDGEPLADVAGDLTGFIDGAPGAGLHRYRIAAIQGGRESFPVAVTALPRGVPGTFVRGDANSDGWVDLSDPIWIVSHLFLGGPPPECLDAADADDSSRVSFDDILVLLIYLFRGVGPLPSPGPVPWFDPTPDDLPCR